MAVGGVDAAYKSVQSIAEPRVWERMAFMCVKNKRLDMAETCLGRMGHARGAMAVRQARKKEDELGAAVAMVAVQLGQLEEAERLYRECGRFDLLNELCQASGQWDRALGIAQNKDRLNLRTTHYRYAQHLERAGEFKLAIKHYELSHTHEEEVPRMLQGAGRHRELLKYVEGANTPGLWRWFGQYRESLGDGDQALLCYRKAGSHADVARIFCHAGEWERAVRVVDKTGDTAAALHVARQLEFRQEPEQAMQLYGAAKAYGEAIRVAIDFGLEHEILGFALMASDVKHQVKAARHLESKGMLDDAVTLFQRAGRVEKALAICFEHKNFEVIRTIAEEMEAEANAAAAEGRPIQGSGMSPEMFLKCAEFFMANGEREKAAHLLVSAKRYEDALELCMRHGVRITEEMAEKMTLEQYGSGVKSAGKQVLARLSAAKNVAAGIEQDGGGMASFGAAAEAAKAKKHDERRRALLRRLAECLEQQGNYYVAAKKFTQGNDKIKAMKCLMRSGDTKKVVYYAQKTRSTEIYLLAGSYLQSLDWNNDPEVMKNIIAFYRKAKAYARLSEFYQACAQVEIDEYRDYDKAAGALKEAHKYMQRQVQASQRAAAKGGGAAAASDDSRGKRGGGRGAPSVVEAEKELGLLVERMGMVDSFCKARKTIGKDAVKGASAPGEGPQYALDVCHQVGVFLVDHVVLVAVLSYRVLSCLV